MHTKRHPRAHSKASKPTLSEQAKRTVGRDCEAPLSLVAAGMSTFKLRPSWKLSVGRGNQEKGIGDAPFGRPQERSVSESEE